MTVRRLAAAAWLLAVGLLPPLLPPPATFPALPPLETLPARLGDWRGRPSPFRPRQTPFLDAFKRPRHAILSRRYQDPDGFAAEAQILYAPQRAPDNLLTYFPATCIHGGCAAVATESIAFGPGMPARRLRVTGKDGEHASLVYWFQSSGRQSNDAAPHLYWLYGQDLWGRRTDGALVTIAYDSPLSPADDRKALDLARRVRDALAAWLADEQRAKPPAPLEKSPGS